MKMKSRSLMRKSLSLFVVVGCLLGGAPAPTAQPMGCRPLCEEDGEAILAAVADVDARTDPSPGVPQGTGRTRAR
jgi:hypothetical protein